MLCSLPSKNTQFQAFNNAYSRLNENIDNLRLFRIERSKNDDFDVAKYNHNEINYYIEKEWEIR